MGVIQQAADNAGNGDGGPSDDLPTHHATPDPFLPEYDLTRIEVDVDTADQLLGLAVVVSNVFG